MKHNALGRVYESGEAVVRQGEMGDCMYVIQEGQLEVVKVDGDTEVSVAVLSEGDFFGEMSLFEREVRAATVRALGPVRVLTVDRKTLMRRVHEDPSLAFNLLRTMCQRIRRLDQELYQARTRLDRAEGRALSAAAEVRG
jgi:CRP-like cAMP-binding protein